MRFLIIFMFKFLSALSKLLIPILIVVFSIITMIPESNLHIEVLNNDQFYTHVAKEVQKNVFTVNDNILEKFGYTFQSREVFIQNPTIAKQYSDAIDPKKVESVIKETIENKLKDIEQSMKSGKLLSGNDYLTQAQNGIINVYKYRMLIIAIILAMLLIVLISAIFSTNRHFRLIAGFYKSISKNLAILLITTFIGLTGWAFVGNITRQGLDQFFGIKSFPVELLDTINWQWAKFVVYLLIPALVFLAISIALMIIFGLLSIFQREPKEIKEINTNFNKKNINESRSENDPSTTMYDNSKSNIVLPLDTRQSIENNRDKPKSNFKTISNTPFPIPEPKSREALDPFLDRLSNSMNEDIQTTDDRNRIRVSGGNK
jgi:hypothetical protein